ncbi:MAG: ethanolamine utilization protein EutJ [Coriobacteriia bacterium]|nr:ethanolamine utilization protein EutJ [Coriobacteriia bacterium]
MFDREAIDEYISKVETSLRKVNKPTKLPLKVGVDLGTAYIVIVVLDAEDNPVACEMKQASVLRDGVVVDFIGAQAIVKELKEKIEKRIGEKLTECAIAMPAGTESSTKTHQFVAEGADFEVINILDEPTAANSIYNIEDGVVVDIGGGTTGLAIFENGKVVQIEDEPTGGTHMSLVLSGNYQISFKDAEKMKLDYSKHKEILPIVQPTIEKMATIVSSYINKKKIKTIYLCGGTSNLTGIEDIFTDYTGIKTVKPKNPFLVTPSGIAKNCVKKNRKRKKKENDV